MSNWQDDRTMTKHQYQWVIRALGMNKAQAGRYLGRGERTAYRLWDGTSEVYPAEALLLRSLIEHGEKPVIPPWQGVKARRAKAIREGELEAADNDNLPVAP
jgi:hypothetical protein